MLTFAVVFLLKNRLTDDVRGLCVVGELFLVFDFAVLVERALVAGFQNVLKHIQFVQVVAQTIDPQSLLMTLNGPTNVCFAWERDDGKFAKGQDKENQIWEKDREYQV